MTDRPSRFNLMFVVPVIVVALVLVVMLTPLPDLGYLFGTFVNFMHVPLFVVVTFVVWLLTGPILIHKPVLKGLMVWGIVGLLGLAIEGMQLISGRSASLHDIVTNLLGSGLTVSLLLATLVTGRRPRRLWLSIAFAALVIIIYTPTMEIYDVIRMRLDFPHIADFESSHELHRWRKANARFKRSAEFAVDSQYSMQVDFLPGEFSGVWIPHAVPDWSNYSNLVFNIYVPANQGTVPLRVKLEDTLHDGTFPDRFYRDYDLSEGSHRIIIPLNEVKLASGREFRLDQVALFQFMIWESEVPHRIFIDRIRLY